MTHVPSLHPPDEFNSELLTNVHPPTWQNPEPAESYHMVVLGAGTAGLVTAAVAAGLGARVALVERHLMGGDCLNAGCVPSKALIRSAREVADIQRAADLGIHLPSGMSVDFAAVMQRMRRLRAQISYNDSARRFKELGVDVFIGRGQFTGPDTMTVDGTELAELKFVDTERREEARFEIPARVKWRNKNRFTSPKVPHQGKTECIQGDTLRSDGIFNTTGGFP